MDRFELVSAFINRNKVTIGGIHGIISSLQHESGSGFDFNITISGWKNVDSVVKDRVTETVYIRCVR
jgi:hypothetical protein